MAETRTPKRNGNGPAKVTTQDQAPSTPPVAPATPATPEVESTPFDDQIVKLESNITSWTNAIDAARKELTALAAAQEAYRGAMASARATK